MSNILLEVKESIEDVRSKEALSALPEVFREKESNREDKEKRLQCAGRYARYGKKGDVSCN